MARTLPLTGDLLYMRDAFNRGASFENPAIAGRLATLTQEFCNIATDPSLGLRFKQGESGTYALNAIMNRKPLKDLEHVLWKMQKTALEAGLNELTLPVQAGGRYAEALHLNVLNPEGRLWAPSDRPLLANPDEKMKEPGPRVVFHFSDVLGLH